MIADHVRALRPYNVLAPRAVLVRLDQPPCLGLREQVGPHGGEAVVHPPHFIRLEEAARVLLRRGGVVGPVEVMEGVLEHEGAALGRVLDPAQHLQEVGGVAIGEDELVDVDHEGELEAVDQAQVALVERREHALCPDLLLRPQGQVPLQDGHLSRVRVLPDSLRKNPSIFGSLNATHSRSTCQFHSRAEGVVVKDKVGDPEDLVELDKFNQPQGSVPVVMKWLDAGGHFPLLFGLLVVIQKRHLVDVNGGL